MGLKETIEDKVKEYLFAPATVIDGHGVPHREDVLFGQEAQKSWSVVMYVDLGEIMTAFAGQANLLLSRVHKSFFYTASECIKNEKGDFRNFNIENILAFFTGHDSAKRAVRSAMKIKCAIATIVNPLLKQQTGKECDFGIGVGQGEIIVAKSGMPEDERYQDLLFMGLPVFHAFEFGMKARSPHNIWISRYVFDSIKDEDALVRSQGQDMWVFNEEHQFPFGQGDVYKTTHYLSLYL